MLDVHPPHDPTHTWKDFFIHIATIVVGLVIAVGLEQTVEYFHHQHELAETREALRRERQSNEASFAFQAEGLAVLLPMFQEDLAVFNYLKAHPGAPRETWPGTIQGRVFNTKLVDSAWKTAQESNVLQYMPQSEVQANDVLYRNVQILNSLVDERFDQMWRLRKTFASEQDAAKLSPAELDQAIDRVVEMISICMRIANRQVNMSQAFPDFKMDFRLAPYDALHWPGIDGKSKNGKAFNKFMQEYNEKRGVDSANQPTASPEAGESAK